MLYGSTYCISHHGLESRISVTQNGNKMRWKRWNESFGVCLAHTAVGLRVSMRSDGSNGEMQVNALNYNSVRAGRCMHAHWPHKALTCLIAAHKFRQMELCIQFWAEGNRTEAQQIVVFSFFFTSSGYKATLCIKTHTRTAKPNSTNPPAGPFPFTVISCFLLHSRATSESQSHLAVQTALHCAAVPSNTTGTTIITCHFMNQNESRAQDQHSGLTGWRQYAVS